MCVAVSVDMVFVSRPLTLAFSLSVCENMYAWVNVCVYVCMYVSMYLSIHVCVHIYAHKHMCHEKYMHSSLSVCMQRIQAGMCCPCVDTCGALEREKR